MSTFPKVQKKLKLNCSICSEAGDTQEYWTILQPSFQQHSQTMACKRLHPHSSAQPLSADGHPALFQNVIATSVHVQISCLRRLHENGVAVPSHTRAIQSCATCHKKWCDKVRMLLANHQSLENRDDKFKDSYKSVEYTMRFMANYPIQVSNSISSRSYWANVKTWWTTSIWQRDEEKSNVNIRTWLAKISPTPRWTTKGTAREASSWGKSLPACIGICWTKSWRERWCACRQTESSSPACHSLALFQKRPTVNKTSRKNTKTQKHKNQKHKTLLYFLWSFVRF